MFSEVRDFSESDLRLISSLGQTQAGQLLAQYIKQEVEGFMRGMLTSKAEDVAAMAYGQAGVMFGEKIHSLLVEDIRMLLDKHNINPEEEDEEQA